MSIIFQNSRYTNIYFKICSFAQTRNWSKKTAPCYTENHHIIPKSLGGVNTKENMVHLTAKEHYICHLLLTKMFIKDTKSYYKMVRAFHRMLSQNEYQNRITKTKQYEKIRTEFAKSISGENNPFYGKTHSPQHKAKLSFINKNNKINLGRKHSPEEIEANRIRGSRNWYLHNILSNEILYITNLKKWCEENNLSPGTMVSVSKGRLKQYKNWQCRKLN